MHAKPNKKKSNSLEQIVIDGMLEKKADHIVLIDLRKTKNAVADFFVICSGNSDTQVASISDSIEEEVRKKLDQKPYKTEGRQEKEWVLLDYVNVVAHVFQKSKRKFYNLENVWGDAVITEVTEEEETTTFI